jgi:hypothetical protein
MIELKKETYQSVSAKNGLFKIKSRLSSAGEAFDLYFGGNCIATVQDAGINELAVCISKLNAEYKKREKLINK